MCWISIDDRLPEEGQEVWAYFKETGISKMTYHNLVGTEDEAFGSNLFIDKGGYLTDDVTSWQPDEGQPLPEPPKEGV